MSIAFLFLFYIMAIFITGMVGEIDLVSSILDGTSISVGDFQIGIFLFMFLFATIGFIVSYKV